MGRLQQLIHEIHRRSLWQVLGVYLVTSWAVLQIVDTVAGALRLPDWLEPVAFVLLIVGLPIVLATAFVQEGLGRRDRDDAEAAADPRAPLRALFTWRKAFTGGVLAFALWGVVAAGWVLFGGGTSNTAGTSGGPASNERSVAVLPFTNTSGDPDNEYFSDGVTEELLNALAQLPDLRVPARTTSFAFKDSKIPIRQIADSLDVAYILDGSVRRSGDRVRITAELIDAHADSHVWSDTYERSLDDIFAIQTQIATAIAEELQIRLGSGASTLADRAPTTNQAAHDLYLRGRFELNQRHIQDAMGYFQQAVAEDSDYAGAYGGLALAGVLASAYGAARPGELDRAFEAADRAIELDSTLSEPHTARGYIPSRIGGLRASEREERLALELDPNDANAHQFLGRVLMGMGRSEEALGSLTRAILLDPSNAAHRWTRGLLYMVMGRLAESDADLREARRLEPDNGYARQLLALNFALSQRPDSLRALALPSSPSLDVLSSLAAGDTDEVRAELESNATGIAVQYGSLAAMQIGDRELAIDYLERGFGRATASNAGLTVYMVLGSDVLAPLRSEPRFQALLRNLDLELP